MITLNGKHAVTEIEGVRCSVAGSGLTEARKDFLRNLLIHNGFEVKSEKEKSKEGTPLETWMLGVTDIRFTPAVAVYSRKLKCPDGRLVTPAIWEQWDNQTEIPYWQVKK